MPAKYNGMQKRILFLFFTWMIIGCNNNKIPDVSHIKVEVELQRFEQDFFAIDSFHVDASMQKLHEKYPGFMQDFIFNILALSPKPEDSQKLIDGVFSFVSSYQPVKDSADKVFGNMEKTKAEISRGLQFVKYYFPTYAVPTKIITFIGPLDSYGNILTTNTIGIGLQLYMGQNYSLYQSEIGQQMYPLYISRKFTQAYIPVNCMKNIIDDIFPNNNAGRPLVEQMIQEGKRMYVLDKLLPETPDSLKLGYTQKQLEGAIANEEMIWSTFVQNDLLFKADPSIVKDYMNDAPNTQIFGADSPGFIGQFVGLQIVKKWMDKQDGLSLQKLLETDPKKIFEEAKYKPR